MTNLDRIGALVALGRRLRAAEEAARPAPAPRRRIAYGGE